MSRSTSQICARLIVCTHETINYYTVVVSSGRHLNKHTDSTFKGVYKQDRCTAMICLLVLFLENRELVLANKN